MTDPQPDNRGAADRRRLLAQRLRQKARGEVVSAAPSVAQSGVWFMQEMDPDSRAYHLPIGIRISSRLNSDRAEAALQHLVDRHAMLRTTFHYTDDELRMRIRGAGDPEFVEIDACGWDDAEIMAAARKVIDRPFNLTVGPLVRMTIFRREPDDHVLLFVLHHLICDGWSSGIILNEFFESYEAELEGRAPRLPPRGPDFQSLVLRQQAWLQSEEGARCRDHWIARLAAEAPPLDFPRYPRRAGPENHDIFNFDIKGDLYRDLIALAHACGVTMFGVLLPVYEVFLMRLSGQTDIVVGVLMAGRTEPGSEGVIGHFVNLVPIRADLTGNPSFREVVARGWTALQNALENQDFPFVELVRILRPLSRSGHTPLFRATLNVVRAGDALSRLMWLQDGPVEWESLRISQFAIDYKEEPYDISYKIIDSVHHLHIKMQYNCNIFTRIDAVEISNCFSSLLKLFVNNPNHSID